MKIVRRTIYDWIERKRIGRVVRRELEDGHFVYEVRFFKSGAPDIFYPKEFFREEGRRLYLLPEGLGEYLALIGRLHEHNLNCPAGEERELEFIYEELLEAKQEIQQRLKVEKARKPPRYNHIRLLKHQLEEVESALKTVARAIEVSKILAREEERATELAEKLLNDLSLRKLERS